MKILMFKEELKKTDRVFHNIKSQSWRNDQILQKIVQRIEKGLQETVKRWPQYKKPVDTFVKYGTPSNSITTSKAGCGLIVITISTEVAFGRSLIFKTMQEIVEP